MYGSEMILFVCTGNTCRSAMAEAILKDQLLKVGSKITVSSAGTHIQESSEATEEAINVLNKIGIDLSSHRSRELEETLVKNAELIVVMTRPQELIVSGFDQKARGRTFLAGEVARFGSLVGPIDGNRELNSWVAELHAARGGYLTSGRLRDEIIDPDRHYLRM